jgi:hypothetical protein
MQLAVTGIINAQLTVVIFPKFLSDVGLVINLLNESPALSHIHPSKQWHEPDVHNSMTMAFNAEYYFSHILIHSPGSEGVRSGDRIEDCMSRRTMLALTLRRRFLNSSQALA